MSFSAAPVLPQEKVVEQVKGLGQQRDQLRIQLEQMEYRLKSIETSLAENDQLRAKVRELLVASNKLFEDEWSRHFEFFPDIHLRAVEDMVNLLAPPKKR